jgi:hypothetical protein
VRAGNRKYTRTKIFSEREVFFLWRVDSILTGHYRAGWIVFLNKNGRETWSAVKYMCTI